MSERSFRRTKQRRLETERRRMALRARRARRAGLTAVAAGAFALTANVAPAAAVPMNFEVDDLGDGPADGCDAAPSCTLRDAVAAADANGDDDTITFQSGLSGDILLNSGPIVIDDDYFLSITGPGDLGGPGGIAVSGQGASQVLNVQSNGGSLTVSGLTLTQGSGDTAGAVYVGFYTNVALIDSAVTQSTATGGQAMNAPTDLAASGGGITSRGDMTITNSVISGNDSTAVSGPDYYGGGGIQNAGHMTIEGSTIEDNYAAGAGGGILQGLDQLNMTLDVSDSLISGNTAEDGGGISAFSVGKYGSSRNSIANTTISDNHSYGYGGGLSIKYLGGDTRWTVTHSTISGNDADDIGGGVALGYVIGSFETVDSTLSGNTADYGGGVFLSEGAQKYQDAVEFNNSTIASNDAFTPYGGGIYLQDCSCGSGSIPLIPLNSTVVANNTAVGSPQDLDQENGATAGGFDLSFSLVEVPGDAPVTQTPAGSSILGVDPQLGGLANNGGPTQTHLPAVTSPVVDKGFAPGPLTTDQRGGPRTVDVSVPNARDGTDIGSVELATGPPAVPNTIFGAPKVKKNKKRVVRTKNAEVNVRVKFTSDVPGATFQCKLDNGKFERCTSPFKAKMSSAPGNGERHTITVKATNPAGDVTGPASTLKFRVIRKG
jgi:hypothetical protein